MDENTKELIENLKQIVSELHRSAGQLDNIIQQIELEFVSRDDEIDAEYVRLYLATQRNYRKDTIRVRFKDLEKKELSIWEQFT